MALGPSTLLEAAHSQNEYDFLLIDHPSEVAHRVVLGPLSRYHLPVYPQGTVNVVSVDVRVLPRPCQLHPRFLN